MKRAVVQFLALIFVWFATAYGQSASVVGTITDPSGGVIPGAEVTVNQPGTGFSRSALTDDQGRFTLASLGPADYAVTVEMPGFKKHAQAITLLADQTLTVNVVLSVGEPSEVVTVEGLAVQPDTQTPTLSQVIEQGRVRDLPLDGRNAAQLTLLVAGTVATPSEGADQGRAKTFPGAVTVSANGTLGNQTQYNLDGSQHNDTYTNVNSPFPFPDAVQEFSVQTSNYSVEYGQNAGGVVNVVTRSGTNDFHGNLFGFHRNKSLNARNFFSDRRDPLKRTQFGGTLGGPILKDRTFFFFGYQGTRIRSEQTGLTSFVPTDRNRQGDFSALLNAANPDNPLGRVVQIRDPLTGQPFPGNLIPRERLSPAALRFLEFIPRAGGNGRIRFSQGQEQDFDEVIARVDHQLTEKDKINVRYFFDTTDDASAWDGKNLETLTVASGIDHHDGHLGWNRVFSPRLISDFNFSFSRTDATRGQPDSVPQAEEFGVKGLFVPPGRQGIESINVSGFFSIGTNLDAAFVRNTWHFKDNVQWVRGGHTFSFGGEYERASMVIRNFFLGAGTFTFTNDVTGFAPASLLLGQLRQFRQGGGEFKDNRADFFGLYIQDKFQLGHRLALTFGLRWDPGIPWDEIRDRVELFREDAFRRGEKSSVFNNAPPGLFFPGDGIPERGLDIDWQNFAPRVGFAYDLGGNGKTVIRAGAGVFYDGRQTGIVNNRFVDVTPFSPQIALTDPADSFDEPLKSFPINPFPAPFPPKADAPFPLPVLAVTYEPGKKFVTPTIYNWNLTVERRLRPNMLARAAYVGSHGSQLREDLELNPAQFIPGSSLGTDARRRFAPLFGSISMASFSDNSSYNSLQLTLEKRPFGADADGASLASLWDRLTLLANYTFSRNIDTRPFGAGVVDVGASSGISPLPVTHPDRKLLDVGPASFDHTHRLVISYIFQFPELKGSSPSVKYLLGGWQTTGIFETQSGGPLTIRAGQDRSRTGLGQDRAVFLGSELGTGSRGPGGCGANEAPCANFLDRSLFALPAVGEFGNVGKGAFRGPNFWSFDMGLFKKIWLGDVLGSEDARLEFRMEFFNIFNNVNFNDPTNTVSSGGFGGIRSARSPRIGQAALKLFF